MVNKQTKGYTKSKIDVMKVFMDMQKSKSDIWKDPKEPIDKWIIRKTTESING